MDNTTEVGNTVSTTAIRCFYQKNKNGSMTGELHFGDTTTSNFLGLATEGAVNNFGDQDRLGLYCRIELKIYGNSNLLKVTIPTSGTITFAEGGTFSGTITASGGTLSGDLTWGNGYKLSNGNNNNAAILVATTGSSGIVLKDSAGTFKLQLYGTGSQYGFLSHEWGDWDLLKSNNGELTLRVSNANRTVIHSGTIGSQTGDIATAGNAGTLDVYDHRSGKL